MAKSTKRNLMAKGVTYEIWTGKNKQGSYVAIYLYDISRHSRCQCGLAAEAKELYKEETDGKC